MASLRVDEAAGILGEALPQLGAGAGGAAAVETRGGHGAEDPSIEEVLAKRSADVGQRASNPSDYTLTGNIRYPDCGRKYIGTVAHGRYNRYRYYVCWTRDRYGTKAGCAVHRFSADELETAVSAAMIEFYTTQHDVINEAVADAQTAHARATSGHRDQLAAVIRDMKENTAAIDRYLGGIRARDSRRSGRDGAEPADRTQGAGEAATRAQRAARVRA